MTPVTCETGHGSILRTLSLGGLTEPVRQGFRTINDRVPRGGVARRRLELLDVDIVAQVVMASGASSMTGSAVGSA